MSKAFAVGFVGWANILTNRWAPIPLAMRSRFTFSLMLALDFDIYLIDEGMPSTTDMEFNRKAGEILQERLRTTTIIIVSHQAQTLEKFARSDGRPAGRQTLYCLTPWKKRNSSMTTKPKARKFRIKRSASPTHSQPAERPEQVQPAQAPHQLGEPPVALQRRAARACGPPRRAAARPHSERDTTPNRQPARPGTATRAASQAKGASWPPRPTRGTKTATTGRTVRGSPSTRRRAQPATGWRDRHRRDPPRRSHRTATAHGPPGGPETRACPHLRF